MVFWNLQVDFVLMITKSCPGSDSASIGKGVGRRSKKGIKVKNSLSKGNYDLRENS